MLSSANLAMAEDDEWIDDDPHAPLQIPEWCCASTFACGRRFDDMTYKEMYENIQELHINTGGNHLDVHARKSDRKGGDMELLNHGHQNYMKCEAKTNWFIDGPKQQEAEGRKHNYPVLVHRSHPRKTLHMGKVSDDIRKYILEQAKCNVAVPSIAAGILEKFACLITDSSIYYALKGEGGSDYVIDSIQNLGYRTKRIQHMNG